MDLLNWNSSLYISFYPIFLKNIVLQLWLFLFFWFKDIRKLSIIFFTIDDIFDCQNSKSQEEGLNKLAAYVTLQVNNSCTGPENYT